MAKRDSVVSFSTERHMETLESMKAAREKVYDRAVKTVSRTGKLHPFVDVHLRIKKSRNSILEVMKLLTLVNGPALPILSAYDGTASMGDNIERFFNALVPFYTLLDPIRTTYDTQLSCMMFQDKDDKLPNGTKSAVQQTEFETGDAIAAQIRELLNAFNGYDYPEEYQLALLQAAFNDLDINRYGLKGYFFLGGDEIGRPGNTADEIMFHLGRKIQGDSMTIEQMYAAAAEKYHIYRIQVGGSGSGARRDDTTLYWENIMGRGHVIVVSDVTLLAEVQAALVWCGETPNPTEAGLIDFIVNGTRGNAHRTADDARKIWSWITEAGVELGVQTKLPNWGKLPKKGDVFAHFRHLWPEGHPNAAENTVPVEDPDPVLETPSAPKRVTGRKPGPVDWGKF